MKSIIAYPYPNCEDELNALRDLANEYVENMAKEQEANLTSKVALKLSGSKDFYGRLNELEAKIKRNMEINKMRRYNDGYLCDIIKDTSKAVEQSPYVYDIPAVANTFLMLKNSLMPNYKILLLVIQQIMDMEVFLAQTINKRA